MKKLSGKLALLVGGVVISMTTLAAPVSVEETAILNAGAADVWALVGDFNGLNHWHPAVSASHQEGDHRTLTLQDGATITEILEDRSNSTRSYRYRIETSPLPVSDYESSIRVEDAGQGKSRVIWASHFNTAGVSDAEAEKVIRNVYRGGLDNLARRFNH